MNEPLSFFRVLTHTGTLEGPCYDADHAAYAYAESAGLTRITTADDLIAHCQSQPGGWCVIIDLATGDQYGTGPQDEPAPASAVTAAAN